MSGFSYLKSNTFKMLKSRGVDFSSCFYETMLLLLISSHFDHQRLMVNVKTVPQTGVIVTKLTSSHHNFNLRVFCHISSSYFCIFQVYSSFTSLSFSKHVFLLKSTCTHVYTSTHKGISMQLIGQDLRRGRERTHLCLYTYTKRRFNTPPSSLPSVNSGIAA